MDAAASEFYNAEEKVYHFKKSTGDKLSVNQMVDYWADWAKRYPIISIEDGFAEDDWEGWRKITEKIGDTVQLVGDDLRGGVTARTEDLCPEHGGRPCTQV